VGTFAFEAALGVGQAEPAAPPFTTFNFLVEIEVRDVSSKIASASFSEVDGLEMTIEPKTIREGGNNAGPVHLAGQVGYGQLTLKRGMTADRDLWRWFERAASDDGRGDRATAEVVVLAADASAVRTRFVLTGCLPVKLKAPALSAKDGGIAVEEMQIVYESLRLAE
jgi:phage tail-like protein